MQFCYNDHHRIRVLLSAVVSPACIQWAATCWFQFDSNVDTNTYDLADRRAVFSTSQLLGANSACKTATDVLSSVEITVYKVLAYRLAGGITPEQAPHRILHASAVHQLQRTLTTTMHHCCPKLVYHRSRKAVLTRSKDRRRRCRHASMTTGCKSSRAVCHFQTRRQRLIIRFL